VKVRTGNAAQCVGIGGWWRVSKHRPSALTTPASLRAKPSFWVLAEQRAQAPAPSPTCRRAEWQEAGGGGGGGGASTTATGRKGKGGGRSAQRGDTWCAVALPLKYGKPAAAAVGNWTFYRSLGFEAPKPWLAGAVWAGCVFAHLGPAVFHVPQCTVPAWAVGPASNFKKWLAAVSARPEA
jgi:hypothetical protein